MNNAVSGPSVRSSLAIRCLSIVCLLVTLTGSATPVAAQLQTESDELQPLDEREGAEFGGALAVSGNIAIIGVSGIHPDPGAAYLFRQSHPGSETWIQQKQLFPQGHEFIRKFGRSVAFDGDTAVVGSNETAGGIGFGGAVYIYERNAGGSDDWGQVKRLIATNPEYAAGFGHSVALLGDTVFISEPFRGDTIQPNTGAVYVHERDAGGPGNWGEVDVLMPAQPIAGNLFGLSVTAGPEMLVVGNLPRGIFSPGFAHVFEPNAGGPGWNEVQVLTASDATFDDDFGISAALDGATLVVGARGARNEFRQKVGAAYVFGRAAEQGPWTEQQKLLPSHLSIGGSYGTSVALMGDFVVIGSPQATVDGPFQGSAWLLERLHDGPEGWEEITRLVASDRAIGDRFGGTVAITGGAIMAGAAGHTHTEENSGAVYVYDGPNEPPIEVEIDIKPEGFPNTINPFNRGVIPVAILGSASFDVAVVDVTTLRFGSNGAGIAHNLNGSFAHNEHLQDVNLDGFTDLITHYRTGQTGISCGDETATLTGETLSSQAFEGSDSIRTVGCRPRRGRGHSRWRDAGEPE